MKLFKLAALVSLLTLFTTGCSINSESPEQLIEGKPIYNEDKNAIYEDIKKRLVYNSKMLVPDNSHEVGAINEADLDKNGVNEIIVFEKKENTNDNKSEVGFLILSKNSNKEETSLLQPGTSIEYANFYDLDGDGYLEIIMLVKNEDMTNMYIYKFEDNEIKLMYEINPTWLKNRKNLTEMKVEIGYIDNDEVLDVLLLSFNPSNNKLYASVVNFKDGLNLLDFVEFDNVKGLSNLYITQGNISSNQVGVILDIPIIDENSYYITQLLYIENDRIIKAFKDDDESIRKTSYIQPEDINKDKVIEIPIDNTSNNMFSLRSSANVSWYRWNGKKDDESGLLFNSQIYYNYQCNFKLEIPNNLVNKLYIEQENNGDNITFKFLYNDRVTSEIKNIFTINVTAKNTVEEKKNIGTTNGIVLGESYDYSFVLYQNDAKQLEELNITTDALRKYFSLIY